MGENIEPEERVLAGGGDNLVGPASEIVSLEREHDRDAPIFAEVMLWLFSPQEARHIDLAEAPDAVRHEKNLLWIDLDGYERATLERVGAAVDLGPEAIRAASSAWQRPRLQTYDENFFVSVTLARPEPQTYRVTAGELDLFVGHNYLITAHRLSLPFHARVLARARLSPELVRLDSAYMLYIVLDELLAYYEDLFESVQGEIDQLEERALTDTSDAFLEDLVRFKRYVTAISRLVEQHRQVFTAFLRPDFHFVTSGDVDTYYRDLESRLARLLDTLQSARDATTDAFDIYVSQMSHRTNQIIRVLTIVSSTLLPVSVIVGLFATSFHGVPLYSGTDFVVMLAVIVILIVGAGTVFRRAGWL